jgi:hypothetical protein
MTLASAEQIVARCVIRCLSGLDPLSIRIGTAKMEPIVSTFFVIQRLTQRQGLHSSSPALVYNPQRVDDTTTSG